MRHRRFLSSVLTVMLTGVTTNAVESRELVCRALAIDGPDCARRVEFVAGPARRSGSETLRVLRRMKTGEEEQITLRSSNPSSLPFMVVLHADPAEVIRGPVRAQHDLLPFVIRYGEQATLVQQGNGVRLTQTVRCLEHGRIGDVVRIREPGIRKERTARIIGPGILEAAY